MAEKRNNDMHLNDILTSTFRSKGINFKEIFKQESITAGGTLEVHTHSARNFEITVSEYSNGRDDIKNLGVIELGGFEGRVVLYAYNSLKKAGLLVDDVQGGMQMTPYEAVKYISDVVISSSSSNPTLH